MIDKFRVYTGDYSVKPRANLSLKPHAINQSTGRPVSDAIAYIDTSRKVHQGKGAFHNSEHFNLDIDQRGFLAIEFNPSKIVHGHNYFAVNKDGLNTAIDTISSEVHSLGIDFSINALELSRVDLARNAKISHPYSQYAHALEMALHPRYMPIHDAETDMGYFKMANKSRQYVFYDKLQELRKEQSIEPESIGIQTPFVTRGELRFMNPRTTKKALGLDTIGEIRTLDGFNSLTDTYKRVMSKDVFRIDDQERMADADNLIESLAYIFERCPKGAVKMWLMVNSQAFQYSMSEIKDMIETGTTLSRQSIYNNMQSIGDILAMSKSAKEIPSYSALLDELYTELVA
jgi:hypothetical protein